MARVGTCVHEESILNSLLTDLISVPDSLQQTVTAKVVTVSEPRNPLL